MSTLKTTILLSALACVAMSSAAFAQDNVPVKAPESLKNVPFKIEGVDGFLQSLGIDPKTEIKLSKKELRSLAESNYNDKTAQHFMSVHAHHGVGCLSCHDQSEVNGTAWMAYVSNPPMKQDCKTCHIPSMPKPAEYSEDQKQVYGELVKWQNPVKEGYKEIRGATERINKLLEVTRLDRDQRTQVLSYVDLATQIADMIEKDGSWGAHAHNYMTQRLAAAQNYVRKAQEILDAGKFSKTAVDPLK